MSRFPLIKKKFREIPLISPKNGHPSCRLGFDSSDVKARRGSTRSNLVKPRPQAGTPLALIDLDNMREQQGVQKAAK